jgi:hypothetical protein
MALVIAMACSATSGDSSSSLNLFRYKPRVNSTYDGTNSGYFNIGVFSSNYINYADNIEFGIFNYTGDYDMYGILDCKDRYANEYFVTQAGSDCAGWMYVYCMLMQTFTILTAVVFMLWPIISSGYRARYWIKRGAGFLPGFSTYTVDPTNDRMGLMAHKSLMVLASVLLLGMSAFMLMSTVHMHNQYLRGVDGHHLSKQDCGMRNEENPEYDMYHFGELEDAPGAIGIYSISVVSSALILIYASVVTVAAKDDAGYGRVNNADSLLASFF